MDSADPSEAIHRHDPLVAGVCAMPRANEVQAQEVLRAYQFDWDDEMVSQSSGLVELGPGVRTQMVTLMDF